MPAARPPARRAASGGPGDVAGAGGACAHPPYTVIRTRIPKARVIRMSVEKVGLPSGASAL